MIQSHLAAHHFSDLPKAIIELTRLTKLGGFVAVIDMEGDDNPAIDELNYKIKLLDDPNYVLCYTEMHSWKVFVMNEL